jgi:hypothetical protein
MMLPKDSVFALIELMKTKVPEYLELFTARTDEEFAAAFDVLLDKSVRDLERNKVNFKKLNEEGLSAALAHRLTMPGVAVTQETNSNGHVDITIQVYLCNPQRTKLCEAKIYDGPSYHIGGLGQLLDRYSTGRESRLLIITYVKKKNINGLIQKLRGQLDRDRPLRQKGATRDHAMKWSFVTTHVHGSGDELEVGHIGCNLHIGR